MFRAGFSEIDVVVYQHPLSGYPRQALRAEALGVG
jgi:hypothetical protein